MDQETPEQKRRVWWQWADRIGRPVLHHLANNRLRAEMPVESGKPHRDDRPLVTHLEAVGRTLMGLAPWLASAATLEGDEHTVAAELAQLAQRGLVNATDRASPDFIDFGAGQQNLVDAAFLCQAMLRAPDILWRPLPPATQGALVAAVESTRKWKPGENNWVLFSATVETWLQSVGRPWQAEVVDRALTSCEAWFKGDGAYGDCPKFHWDYYNSFVIQPMLLETLDHLGDEKPAWAAMRTEVQKRAVRYAAVLERLISVDGSYPPIGRSIAYRCGAFHHLALMALRQQLPEGLSPARVRCALTAVHERTLGASGTFDVNGWLQIGLAGHQPSLGEAYISTGSLYLCSASFVPLGLRPQDSFWAEGPADWTQKMIWAGSDLPTDHAV
ncbi:MAG: DUF2264 domain-containing protein [Tepidisphaeraceae bacterium]